MKNFIKKLITKKNSGVGDMVCSLLAILALVIMLFLSISVVKDVDKVTTVDQVARQCVINLETYGYIDCASIQKTLEDSGYVFDADDGDGVFILVSESNKYVDKTSTITKTNPVSYGSETAIQIKCKVATTSFGGNIFGVGSKDNLGKEHYTQINRIKASISKTAY